MKEQLEAFDKDKQTVYDVWKIAATSSDWRVEHRNVRDIVIDLNKKVIKNLATFLPQLLKLEKLNERDITNKKQLATILRAMPTLI